MEKGKAILLYKKYHENKNFERLGQFSILAETFSIQRALYPGSFVHITPSFVFASVTYIDIDKRAKAFFADLSIYEYVNEHKTYNSSPMISFIAADYRNSNVELDNDFDLLISQYAGFVSQYCKKYLKTGGILLVNNSHGDASMASIDKDFKLMGVLNKRDDKWSLSENDLDKYFIPKRSVSVTKDYIEHLGRGIGYTKSPAAYLFKKIT